VTCSTWSVSVPVSVPISAVLVSNYSAVSEANVELYIYSR